jgi:hypothetical protein
MRIFVTQLKTAIAARAPSAPSGEDPEGGRDDKSLVLRESEKSHGGRAIARSFQRGGGFEAASHSGSTAALWGTFHR